MVGLKKARETVESAAAKLTETAADTKAAVLGAVALGLLGLVVALIALVVAAKARTA